MSDNDDPDPDLCINHEKTNCDGEAVTVDMVTGDPLCATCAQRGGELIL